MSGRVLLCWRYELLAKVARKRYLTSQEITRSIHGEIANLFFSEFSTDPQPKVEEACKLNVFSFLSMQLFFWFLFICYQMCKCSASSNLQFFILQFLKKGNFKAICCGQLVVNRGCPGGGGQ